MKKYILVLTIILLLAAPATVFAKQQSSEFPPKKIGLKDPTAIPHNLDELYFLIRNGGPGWDQFTSCTEKGLTGSYFQWSMVEAIEAHSLNDSGQSQLILPAADLAKIVQPGGISFPTQGTLKLSEKTLFGALIREVLAGNVLLCKQNGDLTLFGPGAQGLFDRLALYVK